MKKLLLTALVGLAVLGASAAEGWVDITPSIMKFENRTEISKSDFMVVSKTPGAYVAPTGVNGPLMYAQIGNQGFNSCSLDSEKGVQFQAGIGFGYLYFFPNCGTMYAKMRATIVYTVLGATEDKDTNIGFVKNTDNSRTDYKTSTLANDGLLNLTEPKWITTTIEGENVMGLSFRQNQFGNVKGTLCIKSIKFESWEEISDVVNIAGVFNEWDWTATGTGIIEDNCATIVVPNWQPGAFCVKIYDKYYGNNSELQNGEWTQNTWTDGYKDMTLPADANGKTVTFTVAVDTHNLKATWTPTVNTIETAASLKFYNAEAEAAYAWDQKVQVGNFTSGYANEATHAGFAAICNNNARFATAEIVDLNPAETHFALKVNPTGKAGFGEMIFVNHVDYVFNGWARVTLQVRLENTNQTTTDNTLQIIPQMHGKDTRPIYMTVDARYLGAKTADEYNKWMEITVDVPDYQGMVIRYNRLQQHNETLYIRCIEVAKIDESEVVEAVRLNNELGSVSQNTINGDADLGEGQIANAKFVTAINRTPSGIEAVEVVESAVKVLGNTAVFSAPAKVYNLSGVCVAEGNEASLAAGLYIAKVGEKAVKFVVR